MTLLEKARMAGRRRGKGSRKAVEMDRQKAELVIAFAKAEITLGQAGMALGVQSSQKQSYEKMKAMLFAGIRQGFIDVKLSKGTLK